VIKISPVEIPTEMLEKLNEVQQLIFDIADASRDYWIMLASKDSSHLRFDYLTGILPVEDKKGQSVIGLVGELPHLLEEGAPSLDLRTTLLGPKVPTVPRGQRGKHLAKIGGYYRAIPFRHMTPGTAAAPRGKTSGLEMGMAYKGHPAIANAKALGKSIHKAAKKLSASVSAPGQKTVYGGRLQAGMAPKLKEHHKTDIYAGMIRERKTYEKATQSQYYTFRTISTNVTEGWIRPPIIARHYADQVAQYATKLAPEVVTAFLEST